MIRPDGITSPAPIGRIIQAPPDGVYRVREETVPRTGTKVVRGGCREFYLTPCPPSLLGRGDGTHQFRCSGRRPHHSTKAALIAREARRATKQSHPHPFEEGPAQTAERPIGHPAVVPDIIQRASTAD